MPKSVSVVKFNVVLYKKLRKYRAFASTLAEMSGVSRAAIHQMYLRHKDYGQRPHGIESLKAVNAAMVQMEKRGGVADKT